MGIQHAVGSMSTLPVFWMSARNVPFLFLSGLLASSFSAKRIAGPSPGRLFAIPRCLIAPLLRPHRSRTQGKGFAFVQFVIPENAGKALEQLDRHAFHGRLLHIMPARRQPGSSGAEVFGTAGRLVAVVVSEGLVVAPGLVLPLAVMSLSSFPTPTRFTSAATWTRL